MKKIILGLLLITITIFADVSAKTKPRAFTAPRTYTPNNYTSSSTNCNYTKYKKRIRELKNEKNKYKRKLKEDMQRENIPVSKKQKESKEYMKSRLWYQRRYEECKAALEVN